MTIPRRTKVGMSRSSPPSMVGSTPLNRPLPGRSSRSFVCCARLPRRFGLCLWDEWAEHPDTYRPLFDAVMAPIQRPPDLDKLRQAYLDYLSDSYRYLDLKGLPGFVEAVEKAAGLALGEVYTPIHARLERPAGETWERQFPQNGARRNGASLSRV